MIHITTIFFFSQASSVALEVITVTAYWNNCRVQTCMVCHDFLSGAMIKLVIFFPVLCDKIPAKIMTFPSDSIYFVHSANKQMLAC